MADPNDIVGLYQQMAAIQRQQALAKALTEQGMTPINPIQSSGRYIVPISPWQGAAQIGQAAAGNILSSRVAKEQGKLAATEQEALSKALSDAMGSDQQTQTGVAPSSPMQAGGQPQGAAPAQSLPQSGGIDPSMARLLKLTQLNEQRRIMGLPPISEEIFKAIAPTEMHKNALDTNPMVQAQVRKAGTQGYEPGVTYTVPGRDTPFVAPDWKSGTAGGFDVNGLPVERVISGAPEAQAKIAGAIEGAKSSASYVKVGTDVNGRDIYAPAGGGGGGGRSGPAGAGGGGGFMNEAEKSRQQAAGKAFTDYENSLNGRVATGQAIMNRANEVLPLLDKFKTGGALPEERVRLGSIATTAGFPELGKKIAGGDVVAAQELQKQFVQGAMESLKQAIASDGSNQGRITQGEFKVFQDANPNLELQPDAIRKILDFAHRIYLKDLAEQQALKEARGNGVFDMQNWPAQAAMAREKALSREMPAQQPDMINQPSPTAWKYLGKTSR